MKDRQFIPSFLHLCFRSILSQSTAFFLASSSSSLRLRSSLLSRFLPLSQFFVLLHLHSFIQTRLASPLARSFFFFFCLWSSFQVVHWEETKGMWAKYLGKFRQSREILSRFLLRSLEAEKEDKKRPTFSSRCSYRSSSVSLSLHPSFNHTIASTHPFFCALFSLSFLLFLSSFSSSHLAKNSRSSSFSFALHLSLSSFRMISPCQ